MKIEEYILNQLREDKLSDELSRKELYDPFTGEAVVKGGRNLGAVDNMPF